jgi:hypothetical protein
MSFDGFEEIGRGGAAPIRLDQQARLAITAGKTFPQAEPDFDGRRLDRIDERDLGSTRSSIGF